MKTEVTVALITAVAGIFAALIVGFFGLIPKGYSSETANKPQVATGQEGSVNVHGDIKTESGGDTYVTGKGSIYVTKYEMSLDELNTLSGELKLTQIAVQNFLKILEKKMSPWRIWIIRSEK